MLDFLWPHGLYPTRFLCPGTDAEAKPPILWPLDAKSWLTGTRSWCWGRLKVGKEGGTRGWDGWMASLIQWTWVWTNSGRRRGKPGVLQSMVLQRLGHNWAIELSWNSPSISSLHLEEDASVVIQHHLLSLGAGLTSTRPRCLGDGLVRIPWRFRCGLRSQFTQVAVTPSGPDLFQLLLQCVWGQMSVGRLSYGSFLLSKLIPSPELGPRKVRPRTTAPCPLHCWLTPPDLFSLFLRPWEGRVWDPPCLWPKPSCTRLTPWLAALLWGQPGTEASVRSQYYPTRLPW